MSRYTLTVCCLHCGADGDGVQLHAVANGTSDGYSTNAIGQCPTCGRRYLVAVQLSTISGVSRESSTCGSDAGYRRHLRHREHPCERCTVAHRRARTGAAA